MEHPLRNIEECSEWRVGKDVGCVAWIMGDVVVGRETFFSDLDKPLIAPPQGQSQVTLGLF